MVLKEIMWRSRGRGAQRTERAQITARLPTNKGGLFNKPPPPPFLQKNKVKNIGFFVLEVQFFDFNLNWQGFLLRSSVLNRERAMLF